jgi:hypothetical protein
MWLKLATGAAIAALGSTLCFAQGDAAQAAISSCATDTGPAECPATYQAVRATDCFGANGNASCLIRMAKDAAANDCNRAYQLVYACSCNQAQESARNAIKAAGPTGVCKILKGG